jgi:hypothetical protein
MSNVVSPRLPREEFEGRMRSIEAAMEGARLLTSSCSRHGSVGKAAAGLTVELFQR